MESITKILTVLSFVCGIFFTYFRFIDAGQSIEEKKNAQKWYRNIWKTLANSSITILPKLVIKQLFKLDDIIDWLREIYNKKNPTKGQKELFFQDFAFFAIVYMFVQPQIENVAPNDMLSALATNLFIIFMTLLTLVIQFTYFSFYRKDWVFKILLMVNVSLFVTSTAIMLGGDKVMMLTSKNHTIILWFSSNIFFDILSIVLSAFILRILYINDKYYIPLIILDIFLAGIFAVFSLYLGLCYTEFKLSIEESFNILFGYSKDGNSLYFGSSFWAMHTAFLPTLIYLIILFLCVIGKAVVIPLTEMFRRASAVEKPHYYTATFFALIGMISAGIAGILAYF